MTRRLPGLWKAVTRSHTHPRETVDHPFDRGLVGEIKHHRRWREEETRYGQQTQYTELQPTEGNDLCENTLYSIFRLTSVGHKDLQSCVLQQVASGEHGSDLTEHPFTVQTL